MNDLPESAPLSDAGGQGPTSAPSSSQKQPASAHQQPEARHYRLVEYGRPGQRSLERPEIYTTVDDAVAVAERILTQLAGRPVHRPRQIVVFDVWTGEIMARRQPDVDYDDTLCPTCGQTRDPFAKGWEATEDKPDPF